MLQHKKTYAKDLTVPLAIRFSEPLKEQIENAAAMRHISVSQFVREACLRNVAIHIQLERDLLAKSYSRTSGQAA
jgi:uncharacterized protein (DUF1778 family)